MFLLALAPAVAHAAEPTRTTLFRGRVLTYKVVDGLAVHAGDMILGTAEEAALARPGIKDGKPKAPLTPRAATLRRPEEYRWPNATVPYVIDEEFSATALSTIHAAIDEWNTRTVVNLIPRTAEVDYVRFTAWPACSSQVGRVGGEQVIRLHRTTGCYTAAAIHEIGHTVGLYHEHQRLDRDEHLTIRSAAVANSSQYRAAHPGSGPYDPASVMHYVSRHMETIPPGMPIRPSGRLSAGDIDGVARMYGQTPTTMTIATNPPGLEIVIDGIRTPTPVTLDWGEGSVHTLAVPMQPQVRGGTRYLFGRWNDGAPRSRSVKVAPAQQTWLEANFIVQRQIVPSPSPRAAGTVNVSPGAPDGWHTIRSETEWTATPTPGTRWRLLRWNDGLAAITRPQRVFAAYSGRPALALAHFTAAEVVRVEPTNGPVQVWINDVLRWTPTAYAPYELGGTANISVPEVQYSRTVDGRRYRFEGWNDGSAAERTVDLARAAGTTLKPQVIVEHHIATRVIGTGEIALDPPAEDGWYATTATPRVTATPAEGWEFVSWSGEVAPSESQAPSLTIEMSTPRLLTATFSRTPSIPAGGAAVILPSFGEARGYRVEPPADATSIAVTYTSPAGGANVDLYVKAIASGAPEGLWTRVYWYRGWRSWDPATSADFGSESPGNTERVVISGSTTPPLDPTASYFVILVSDRIPRPAITGSLQLEVTTRTGPEPPRGSAWPRALTFVGPIAGPPPPAQTVTLTNDGGSDMNFQATTDQTWLTATPPAGTIAPGESAEIALSGHPAGLLADTLGATLTVSRSGTDGTAIEALEIPVAFAAY